MSGTTAVGGDRLSMSTAGRPCPWLHRVVSPRRLVTGTAEAASAGAGVVEHGSDEPQLAPVALDPLATVAAGGPEHLRALLRAAPVALRPGDERPGPRPLVRPTPRAAHVRVAHLEALPLERGHELGEGREVAGAGAERLLGRSRRLPLSDGVAHQRPPPGAQVPAEGVERAAQPAERVARPDADDRLERRVGAPGRQVAASASTQASRSPTPRASSRTSRSGCRGVSTPDGGEVGPRLQQLEEPPAGTAAEVDHPTGSAGSSRSSSRRTMGSATGAAMGWSVWAMRLISARSMGLVPVVGRHPNNRGHGTDFSGV